MGLATFEHMLLGDCCQRHPQITNCANVHTKHFQRFTAVSIEGHTVHPTAYGYWIDVFSEGRSYHFGFGSF